MAFIAAGRTRPKVSQAVPDKKPGACSLMEEITASKSPNTSQAIPLVKRNKSGPRQDASISPTVALCTTGEEGASDNCPEGGAVDADGFISKPRLRHSSSEFRVESKIVLRNSSFEWARLFGRFGRGRRRRERF